MNNRKIPFWKMDGAGNDFVLLDRDETKIPVTKKLTRTLLDRHYGVGADQLVVLTPGNSVTDSRLEFYNADGSIAEMCGNGTRAAAYYLRAFKGVRGNFEFKTKTRQVVVQFKGEKISVDMGNPIWEGSRIPVKASGEVLDYTLNAAGQLFKVNCVSMGNPHAVIYVKDLARLPIHELGPVIENHPFFPNRVNVEFVELLSPTRVKVRVWERGTGATLACGSGACAVGAVGVRLGKTTPSLRQDWPGGVLSTHVSKDFHVHLSGPAEVTFRGTFLV